MLFWYLRTLNAQEMEISHSLNKNEHQTVDNSLKIMSILSLDSHLSSNSEPEPEPEPGPPHEALFLVLAYLPVLELLTMTEVCSSFRAAVNNDVLPWLDPIIEKPLSSWLSNKILMKIAAKADGRLRTLTLINCGKITDDGLQWVVDQNPVITKVHVPGCTRLTPDGIIRAVTTLSHHHHNNSLTSLRINGIYNLSKQHLEALSSCLQMNTEQKKPDQPILYRHHGTSLSSGNQENDGMIIDVGICPECKEVRIVFDCPREACKSKCRGCRFCIPRCEECGECVESEEVDETVCGGILCSSCWVHLPKCNFCNKPYCKQHLDELSSSSSGFVCDVCQEKASNQTNEDDSG